MCLGSSSILVSWVDNPIKILLEIFNDKLYIKADSLTKEATGDSTPLEAEIPEPANENYKRKR